MLTVLKKYDVNQINSAISCGRSVIVPISTVGTSAIERVSFIADMKSTMKELHNRRVRQRRTMLEKGRTGLFDSIKENTNNTNNTTSNNTSNTDNTSNTSNAGNVNNESATGTLQDGKEKVSVIKGQGKLKMYFQVLRILYHCVTILVCNYRTNYFYLFIPLLLSSL